MRIHILCNDGSPLGVVHSDIYGEGDRIGLGGAEIALMTMAEAWSGEHEVVLYNNPRKKSDRPFEQRKISDFEPDANRDVLIVFRSPTPLVAKANGMRVWWSCDQYTVGNFSLFSKFVDKIVTISPFHAEYFKNRYEITDTITIDLPVRIKDYGKHVDKVEKRVIFTSVPDRGLHILAQIFPEIHKRTGASLVVTSDYRLWGAGSNNSQHIQRFLGMDGVEFLGAVKRDRLVEEQLKAQVHLYPCVYEELFCISVAESQVAGVLPITTAIGSLSSTNMGVLVNGDANSGDTKKILTEKTIEYLESNHLGNIQKELSERAKERFSLKTIKKQWDEKVFK